MNIKSGFELRNICGENIIVSFGLENIDFSKVISMNESAATLWNALVNNESFTIDDMVNILTSEYEVSDEQARVDCQTVIRQWAEAGLLDLG